MKIVSKALACRLNISSIVNENQVAYVNNRFFQVKGLDYNLVHNILELHNALIQTQLTTSKTKRDI